MTASAIPEQVDETPVAATVITRAEIERRGARDVSDVLREVPGLAVSRTGSAGKQTSLFIRGGSSKQALVLWNGVEMNNAYFSGYNFGQLSTAGVEKVEVVRGPFSALYGSEAVSGVVNVLTTPATTGGAIDVEAGDHGLFNAAAHGAFTADRWSAHFTVERRQDEGFARNDHFESTSILGGASFMPREGLSVGFLGRHSVYDLGIPFAPNASYTGFEPRERRGEDGAETQLIVPVRLELRGMVYELRLSEGRRDDDFEDVDARESSSTRSTLRGVRATARTGRTPLGTITGGAELERAVVDHLSNFSVIDERERSSRALFLENRRSIALGTDRSIELTAGVRYDDFDTFGSEVTPRIAAAWVSGPHKFRGGYGQGFRAPAIGELYSPFFGNPDLEAEQSRTVEAGYEYWSRGTRASVTLFDSSYDELIAFGTSRFENIAEASARGVELAAGQRWGAFDLSATYTWLDTEDAATGRQLLRRPEHSGSLAVGFLAGPFSTQLVVAHKGDRSDVTDIFPWGVVTNEAHTTADVTVRYTLGALVPYAKIENLSDETYEEVFGYRSPGRRFVGGVRYGFGRR